MTSSRLFDLLDKWNNIVHVATEEPSPCKIDSFDESGETILVLGALTVYEATQIRNLLTTLRPKSIVTTDFYHVKN
jgi:hypothetical protein